MTRKSPVPSKYFVMPDLQQWEQAPPLNQPRCFHSCAVVNGQLVVFGGIGADHNPVESVEQLDLIQGMWLTLADDDSLPEEIGHGVLCEYVEIAAR